MGDNGPRGTDNLVRLASQPTTHALLVRDRVRASLHHLAPKDCQAGRDRVPDRRQDPRPHRHGRHTAARQAIEGFTRALNEIDGIYTVEREDAATAVLQLARLTTPPIPEHDVLAWFDRGREF
ncbi:hypothetical protein [Streptomyces sp. ALI-76-A]|uniref:hypothetical protein n=1 Tax=Streptomyces sp. ALI-76-A TaxID=3025736 RepID=UPI00256F1780|nr:hypothetical protein [Streptomyces sp. ALI-76-A]MDL5199049.1 hypothetical protein [Streptomyces sp. ALI-76-A]